MLDGVNDRPDVPMTGALLREPSRQGGLSHSTRFHAARRRSSKAVPSPFRDRVVEGVHRNDERTPATISTPCGHWSARWWTRTTTRLSERLAEIPVVAGWYRRLDAVPAAAPGARHPQRFEPQLLERCNAWSWQTKAAATNAELEHDLFLRQGDLDERRAIVRRRLYVQNPRRPKREIGGKVCGSPERPQGAISATSAGDPDRRRFRMSSTTPAVFYCRKSDKTRGEKLFIEARERALPHARGRCANAGRCARSDDAFGGAKALSARRSPSNPTSRTHCCRWPI